MTAVRKSARLTGTFFAIAVAAIAVYIWYSMADIAYFSMVKAFMRTKTEIGGVHIFLIKLAFWASVIVSIINAAFTDKYGLDIMSALGIPLCIMCALALWFIPSAGLTNIHMFWLVCYILIVIGTWFSARKISMFCSMNSNISAKLKDPETPLEMKGDRVDFMTAMLLTLASCVLLVAVVIGALVFGIKNWELISGEDDVTPVVFSVRYDTAAKLMEDGEYERAMTVFKDLEDYSDSGVMAAKCADQLYHPTYLEGIKLINQGEYDEARAVFWSIYDYRDSAKKIEQCDNLQYGPQYDEAIALLDNGLYEDALEVLETLESVGYKDVSEKIELCKRSLKAVMLMGLVRQAMEHGM